jgi:GT2 family glycosyltransferase
LTLKLSDGRSANRTVVSDRLPISIVIPTYRRDDVLISTIRHLLDLGPAPAEILVLDQTEKHQEDAEIALREWAKTGAIGLMRLAKPSIPRAMNRGLCEAGQDFVLFVDDDIVPEPGLLQKHLQALDRTGAALVAGRVIQPWHEEKELSEHESFHFASLQAGWIGEFMGGNFTVRREIALKLGGFDERFVGVAYNFEAEFAYRLCQAGHSIYYEPGACIHHLRVREGGTRAFGDHLKSFKPNHAVGAYYFILRTWSSWQSMVRFFGRPLQAIATRHHIRRPWWIVATLIAELSGMVWAVVLALQGPRYLHSQEMAKGGESRD